MAIQNASLQGYAHPFGRMAEMDGQTDEGKGAALEEQEPQVAEPKPKGAAVDLAERQEEHGKDEYGLYDGYGGFCPGPCCVEQRAVGIEQVSQHTGENRDGECPVPDEIQGEICCKVSHKERENQQQADENQCGSLSFCHYDIAYEVIKHGEERVCIEGEVRFHKGEVLRIEQQVQERDNHGERHEGEHYGEQVEHNVQKHADPVGLDVIQYPSEVLIFLHIRHLNSYSPCSSPVLSCASLL